MNTSIDISYTPVDFDPFAGPAIELLAPLTEPQTELWLACQFGGDDANRAYNESISVRLHGSLDRAAFEWAMGAVVERHQALRSAFSGDGKTMLVFRDAAFTMAYDDLSGLAENEQQTAIDQYLSTDAQHIFDLQNGPLVGVRLLKLADTEHLFVLAAHHIVCDGWSFGVALQDLSTLYSERTQGQIPQLPPAEQIGAYAIEQIAFEQTADYKSIENFWLNQYRDPVPVLDLPLDFPRPARRTYASHRQDYRLDDKLTLSLRKLGQRAGCSFVSTLLVSFEVLLHRLTGQTDLVVGLPAAGQSATNHQRLVGHCVNLLPIRSHPQPNQSFIDYLKSRREPILDAFENQRLTFGSLLKKLPIPRDPARIPLVPVMFNVEFGMDEGVHFQGLTFDFTSNPRQFEAVDLFVNAGGTQQSLTIEWSYNTQLFRPETIAGFHRQFVGLLECLVADPSAPLICPVNLIEAPAVASPKQTLHELLGETARTYPDKVAVRFNGQSLTYAQLHGQANQLAHVLIEKGVRPGDRVGLSIDRSLELVVSLLAVMKAGGQYIPTDPRHPTDRIQYVMADASCSVLLTNRAHEGRIALPLRELLLETIWPTLDTYPPTEPVVLVAADAPIYVLYTSGTTGRPKGVQIRHDSVVNVLQGLARKPGLTATDKTVTMGTIAFDITTAEIYLPLLVGAELVVVDAATVSNGQTLAALLVREQITFVQTTPATLRMLWETGWRGNANLRVISCAEALPSDLAQKLLATCAALYNYYGPTETTVYATGTQILSADAPITIGVPIDNARIVIVDEQLQPVADGQPGELLIGGAGVGSGYLNQPKLTDIKFIRPSFAPHERFYRTGDLGKRMPAGDIQYLGRIDAQIKIRGHRIEPGEVEHHLIRIDDIENAVVVAREDQPGHQRLVAYVVLNDPTAPTCIDREQVLRWRAALSTVLPAYMVPGDFVALNELPVTPNGKLDRKALPTLEQAAPTGTVPRLTLPSTPEEKQIAGIWQQVFGLATISIDDNFFDLGGHSMLAVRVMAQLERETGRRLPVSTLFESATIRSMARLIRPEQRIKLKHSLVPIKPYGSKMPIYVVHGGGLNLLTFRGLIEYMDPEQPIYGFQARGLDGTEEPLDSMEAIAADYLEELLEQNPDGPYALAGYSFGGYVALEMARQLHDQGKTVKLLGMFDTNAEDSAESRPFLDRMAWRIGRQLPKMAWIGRSLIEHPLPTLRYQGEYVERQVKNVLKAVGLADEQTYSEIQDENLLRIIEKHEIAFHNYRMQPYDGLIDVFKAKKRLYFVEDREFLGWKKYALQGVRIHNVPGDHKEMLHPPNDKEFARILQQALDQS